MKCSEVSEDKMPVRSDHIQQAIWSFIFNDWKTFDFFFFFGHFCYKLEMFPKLKNREINLFL